VYNNIGWSFLAGVVAILALMPLQLWRAGRVEVLEEDRLKTTDERVRLTSEILSNAKIVKLYGWEFAFKNRILAARSVELNVLKRIGLLEAIMSVVFASSSVIIALVTFTVYVTVGKGVLTPKTVFVSITLFDMLHEPLSRLAEG
jgi:ABC-type multidrug transport system fused ATPase/permease subunit